MPSIPQKAFDVHIQRFLGIDPGGSGGMALLAHHGALLAVTQFDGLTDHEVAAWLKAEKGLITKAAIEKVGAMPGQGVVSMFTFGKSYGFLRGLLVAFEVPLVEVPPQTWMKRLAIPSRGDKTKTEHKKLLQAKAHERWPSRVKDLGRNVADAALIAEWLRLEETRK
jgi:hypothetical protein